MADDSDPTQEEIQRAFESLAKALTDEPAGHGQVRQVAVLPDLTPALEPSPPGEISAEYRHFLLEQIARCQLAFESGHHNFSALLQALDYAGELAPPLQWMASAVASIIWAEMTAESEGTIAHWKVQFKQDLIDFVRADFIDDARRHGFTWKAARDCAAEYFQGTEAGSAGPDEMMRSWQRVHEKGEAHPGRYFITSDADCIMSEFRPPSKHARAVYRKYVDLMTQAGRYIPDADIPDPDGESS